MFGDHDRKVEELTHKFSRGKEIALHPCTEVEEALSGIDWRDALRRKYTGTSQFLTGLLARWFT